MYKKLITIILTIVMCASIFTGCTLFTYDYERDYKQVVATVAPVTMTEGEKTFTTEKKNIYKYELINSVNSYASTYVNSYGMTIEEAVDYLLEQLVVRELVLNEADAELYFGNIKWTNYEENQVKKGIYTTIDSELATLRNEILTEHGEAVTGDTTATDTESSTETTYPVREEDEVGAYDNWDRAELMNEVSQVRNLTTAEKADEYTDYKLRLMLEKDDLSKEEPWAPGEIRYPGRYGSDEVKSLEIEAMRRFLNLLQKNIDNDYRVSDAQKATFTKEINDLKKLGNEKGLSYVYPELGDTQLMEFFVGESYRENLMLGLLEEYITDSVDVTDDEVSEYYANLLSTQRNSYAAQSNYDSAVSGSADIYYYPNGSYYFVKHILVPFSDEQTAELTDFVDKYTGIKPQAELDQKKIDLSNEITGFEHRNGENYGYPLTLDAIYEDIQNTMNAANTLKDKERAFDELIYKYNTDEGIFGKTLGYQVKVTEGDAIDTTYMKEFSEAAKALYEAGVEGAISPVAVTDYGAHILYLSKIIPSGGETVGLYDYTSYGEYGTVYEKIREAKLTEKINDEFSKWQNTKIAYYYNLLKIVTVNESTFADLIEEK